MNLLHIKYAVEVAKHGSINKAAEALLVAQPNVSRSIKELEADLGIEIFKRSAKGMVLTPEGESFIRNAEDILTQLDDMERLYKKGMPDKQKFSVSVPHACYISHAFARFSNCIQQNPAEIFFKETSTQGTIQDVLNQEYKLGIIRYAGEYDEFIKSMLEEKGLNYESIAEFQYVLMMSKKNPLATKAHIAARDLLPYIEIYHSDPYVPPVPLPKQSKETAEECTERRIYLFERASRFEVLSENPETFMWVSPGTEEFLERHRLVQRVCEDRNKIYKDVLIYRKGYKLSLLDNQFISALRESKSMHIN